jgi:hypothetical protein
MRKAILGTVLCLFTSVAAVAQTPDAQMMAPIQKFMDTFNTGDVAGAAATHASGADLVIVDEVPPFVWRGAQAFQQWIADLDVDAKKNGATDQQVTISKPTRTEVSGDQAYVIVPASYTFKQRGVAMRETAQMTFVLKKSASGWLIQGWAWTGGRATAATGGARP